MNGKLCLLYFKGVIDVGDCDFIYALSCHNEYFYGGKILYKNSYNNNDSFEINMMAIKKEVFIRLTNISGKNCSGVGKLVGIA